MVNEKARASKIYEALSICFDRKWPCSDGPRPERLTAQVGGRVRQIAQTLSGETLKSISHSHNAPTMIAFASFHPDNAGHLSSSAIAVILAYIVARPSGRCKIRDRSSKKEDVTSHNLIVYSYHNKFYNMLHGKGVG